MNQIKKEDVEKIKEKVIHASIMETCMLLQSRFEGLHNKEVEERLDIFGKNEIEQNKKESFFKKLIVHFTSLMAILLWIGGTLAIFSGSTQLGISIYCVNIINGCFSFFQEFKAEKATSSLTQMMPTFARVLRNRTEYKIDAKEVVVGDILIVSEGDKICADARILRCNNLMCNESALSGESVPVLKTAEISSINNSILEAKNMVFSGSSVSYGSATCMVVATGMQSEFGKIAHLTSTTMKTLSPLQKELNILTKQIAVIAILAGTMFMVISYFFIKDTLIQSFLFALGMVVAFIPEGLLPAVTLSLALAVQKMAKEKALVKKLSAVETLGCTNVICTDKTGTLTQNEMCVKHIWTFLGDMDVSGEGYSKEGSIYMQNKEIDAFKSSLLRMLLSAITLCNDARLSYIEEEKKTIVLGDPTEACLHVVAQKGKLDIENIEKRMPRIGALSFDSNRKCMTTIHQLSEPIENADRIAFVKGSLDRVVSLCTKVYGGNEPQELTQDMRLKIMEKNDAFAKKGLRVLAVAYRPLKENDLPNALREYTSENIEKDLTFLGLVSMQDPPRNGVKEAALKCRKAGIKVIMITGDYGLTAKAIAKEIGIVEKEEVEVISGVQLTQMSEEELEDKLKEEVVFARMAPDQKYRIVSALQKMGNVVAVTGDGVNDSPALKKADIGIAMGISGSDVAKESADMILADDNFSTIVKAIEEGRCVYSNIRKFLRYIFDSNTPEALAPILYLLSGGLIPLPLTIMQILMIDIGTDMVPALGLGAESVEEGIMEKPPRSLKERLLNKNVLFVGFLWYGLIVSVFAFGGYLFVNYMHGFSFFSLAKEGTLVYKEATTLMLAGVVFAQIGMVMNNRTDSISVFKKGLFKNKYINIGILSELILLFAIIYIPIFHEVFNTTYLSLIDLLYLLPIPAFVIFIEEIRKKVKRKRIQRKR